ncbi:MAG: hypothetical protein ABUJ98_11655 [Hyphomicrobium sp.]|jgi:hypothetical protein
MSCPTVDLDKKKVILLNGFEMTRSTSKPFAIKAKKQLEEAAKRHRDAVAFGYVLGKWVPAA